MIVLLSVFTATSMYYIDPVCKKKLRRKEEYAIVKANGEAYHLCCKACKDAFEKDQTKYLSKRGQSLHH